MSKFIYFVRHGETDANLKRYVPGREESLNQTGFVQAEAIAKRTRGMEFEKLIASGYVRAQQTAELIANRSGLKIHTVELFGEVSEPTSLHGLSEEGDEVIEHRRGRNGNVENPDWRMEDGENFYDVFERIKSAKQYLEQETANSILVTSHSFFMQLFAAAVLLNSSGPTQKWFEVGSRFKVSNTGVTLYTVDEAGWRLVMWNDHAHFAE